MNWFIKRVISLLAMFIRGGKRFVKRVALPIIKIQYSFKLFLENGEKIEWETIRVFWNFGKLEFEEFKRAIYLAAYKLKNNTEPNTYDQRVIEAFIEKRYKELYAQSNESFRNSQLIKIAAIAAQIYHAENGKKGDFKKEHRASFLVELAFAFFKSTNCSTRTLEDVQGLT